MLGLGQPSAAALGEPPPATPLTMAMPMGTLPGVFPPMLAQPFLGIPQMHAFGPAMSGIGIQIPGQIPQMGAPMVSLGMQIPTFCGQMPTAGVPFATMPLQMHQMVGQVPGMSFQCASPLQAIPPPPPTMGSPLPPIPAPPPSFGQFQLHATHVETQQQLSAQSMLASISAAQMTNTASGFIDASQLAATHAHADPFATPPLDTSAANKEMRMKMKASVDELTEKLNAQSKNGNSGRGGATASSAVACNPAAPTDAAAGQTVGASTHMSDGSRSSPTSVAALDQPEHMQMIAANQSAQEMQYMQQFQFYQQLQAQEAERRKQNKEEVQSRFKESFRPMRICKHLFQLGLCRQGQECTFGHIYEELHPASPDLPKDWNSTSTSSSSTNMLAEQGEIPESQVPDMRLKKKKEMCGRFSRGECSLGKICPFAHTEAELGSIGLSVCGKVKTRLCVFWDAATQTAKGCIYGANCNNAHGEREIGTKRPPPELAPPMKRRREGESVIAGRD